MYNVWDCYEKNSRCSTFAIVSIEATTTPSLRHESISNYEMLLVLCLRVHSMVFGQGSLGVGTAWGRVGVGFDYLVMQGH